MAMRQRSDDHTEPNGTEKPGKDAEKGDMTDTNVDFEQSHPPDRASIKDRIAHFTW